MQAMCRTYYHYRAGSVALRSDPASKVVVLAERWSDEKESSELGLADWQGP